LEVSLSLLSPAYLFFTHFFVFLHSIPNPFFFSFLEDGAIPNDRRNEEANVARAKLQPCFPTPAALSLSSARTLSSDRQQGEQQQGAGSSVPSEPFAAPVMSGASLYETLALADRNFPYLYRAYENFRKKGWVVRSGIKFGAVMDSSFLFCNDEVFFNFVFSISFFFPFSSCLLIMFVCLCLFVCVYIYIHIYV
jgi:hypothetical protein